PRPRPPTPRPSLVWPTAHPRGCPRPGALPGRPARSSHQLCEARPPLRPAFFFWAVVPPWEPFPPEPLFFPPRLEAPGLLAIFAARSLDMPLSLSASYCFSFLTLADLLGIGSFLSPSLARQVPR